MSTSEAWMQVARWSYLKCTEINPALPRLNLALPRYFRYLTEDHVFLE